MARQDKDIMQKQLAVRFATLQEMLPFLEVNIENRKELSETTTVITDIDVLGVSVNQQGALTRALFDCKTNNKTSPINRAFWAAGLMSYTNANEAFVILKKKATEAHRLSAKCIDVYLFNEQQFSSYAEAFSLDFKTDYCYLTNIDAWLALQDIYLALEPFKKFGQFLNTEVPLERHPDRGIKKFLAGLSKGAGEFDPQKSSHTAVYFHALMAFSFLMSQLVHDLKNIIEFDCSKEEFEKILRFYIWGGREAYLQRKQLADLFSKSNPSVSPYNVEINEWEGFIELTRKLLDAPQEVFSCCRIARELSLREASGAIKDKDEHLAKLIAQSSRTRQFLSAQSKYLVQYAQLPSEMNVRLSETFDELKAIAQ